MNAAVRVGSYFRPSSPKRGFITKAGYNFLHGKFFAQQSSATQGGINEQHEGGDMTPPLNQGEPPTPVVLAERRTRVFDPTIGWPFILTVIVVFSGFCLWITRGYYELAQQVIETKQDMVAFQKQVSQNDARVEAQQAAARSQSAQERADLRTELREISSKMDRVLFGDFTRPKR